MFQAAWRPYALLVFAGITLPCAAFAQSNATGKASNRPGYVFDCADVTIDFKDNPNLTNEEKIKLMDRALSGSLSRFDSCQQAMQDMRKPEAQNSASSSAFQGNAGAANAADSQAGDAKSNAAKAAAERQQAVSQGNGQGSAKPDATASASSAPPAPKLPPSATARSGTQSQGGFESVPAADMSGTENSNADSLEARQAATAAGGQAGDAAGAAMAAGTFGFGSVASSTMSGT
ncbi:MAG: hypothetical protein VW338_07710, partial [Rhodospirillaceae bacterium]